MKSIIRILILVAGLLALPGYAAALTTQQMQTLKSAALADPTAAAYLVAGNDSDLQAWFNAANTKIVWRSTISPDLMREALVCGATQLDGLTVGKRDSLFYLAAGDLNNSANLRASIDDLSGTQNTLKACLVAAQKRTATKAEAILATGTGTTQSPATMGWEGFITDADVIAIRSQ